jgi:hypothetical protein
LSENRKRTKGLCNLRHQPVLFFFYLSAMQSEVADRTLVSCAILGKNAQNCRGCSTSSAPNIIEWWEKDGKAFGTDEQDWGMAISHPQSP